MNIKKCVVGLVLLTFLAVSSFAEDAEGSKGLSVEFEARAGSDLMFFNKAVDTTDTTDFSNGVKSKDDRHKGVFHFMNSRAAWQPAMGAYLRVRHTGEQHEVFGELKMEGLLQTVLHQPADVSLNTLWGAITLGDWHIKGNAGIFDGYVGNTGYKGAVDTYAHNFNDYMDGYLKVEDFGFYMPGDFIRTNRIDWGSEWMDPYSGQIKNGNAFALGIAPIEGIKVAMGTLLGWNAASSWMNPKSSAASINASFLVSASDLVEGLNLDLFYGVAGGDYNTSSRYNPIPGAPPPGMWLNSLGLYAGYNIMEGMGVSFGYTMGFLVNEKYYRTGTDGRETTKGYSYSDPLYNAVNLHVNFAAMENLDLSFNNNITFAFKSEKNDVSDPTKTDKYKIGTNNDRLNKGESTNYLVWHGALAAKYNMSEEMWLNAQLANKVETNVWRFEGDVGNTKYSWYSRATNNYLGLALSAGYTVGYVSIEGGLNMGWDVTKNSNNHEGKENIVKNGDFKFGIPVLFKVVL